MDENGLRDRIKKVLLLNGKTVNSISGGNSALQVKLNRQIRGTSTISAEAIEVVARNIPDLNIEWLLTGEGEMLKTLSSGGQVVASGDSSVAAMNSHVTTSPSPTVEQLRTELELKDQVIAEKERLIKVLLDSRNKTE